MKSVTTISFKIRIPRVIVLLVFDRLPKKEVKFTRHNVFERDKNTCQYCGQLFDRSDLNLDHVVPRDRGGTTTWENVVCSCIPCNTRKGNRLPREAHMSLIRKPKRPKVAAAICADHLRCAPARSLEALRRSRRYWNVEFERLVATANRRAFDSLAPASSRFWLPVHVALRPSASFCETASRLHRFLVFRCK